MQHKWSECRTSIIKNNLLKGSLCKLAFLEISIVSVRSVLMLVRKHPLLEGLPQDGLARKVCQRNAKEIYRKVYYFQSNLRQLFVSMESILVTQSKASLQLSV